jgi:hypothetical protein
MDILITSSSLATTDPFTINADVPIKRVHYDSDANFPAQLNNFYDMVWCKGCPIYGPFDPDVDQRLIALTVHVLNEAQRVLKGGGIFVMPLNPKLIEKSSLRRIEKKAKASIVDPSEGRWSMELTKIADMPVRVETTYEDALVFTKKEMMVGGRQLARKTMRRRYRR